MATLPSYNALVEGAKTGANPVPTTTQAFRRLYWTLQGPAFPPTGITVMRGPFDPDSPRELYYQGNSDSSSDPGPDSSSEKWHPISQEPFSIPKVGSITVEVFDLENWASNWYDQHCLHSYPDDVEEEGVTWIRPSPGSDDGSDGVPTLVQCCGADQPKQHVPLVVTAAPRTDGQVPFVTIHDYVMAVHPWLLGQMEDIRQAINDDGFSDPVPEATKLAVHTITAESLRIKEEDDFRQRFKILQFMAATPPFFFVPTTGPLAPGHTGDAENNG